MAERAPLELYDIEDAVQKLRHVLADRTVEDLEAWKSEHPEVPWRKIAGIGNVLRHGYRKMKTDVIVRLRDLDLHLLESAVARLMQKYDPEGVALRERLRAAGKL